MSRIQRAWRALLGRPEPQPRSDLVPALRMVTETLRAMQDRADDQRQAYVERVHELAEARQMAGIGPWIPDGIPKDKPIHARETLNPIVNQGAYGDIELALQNVEWRREINLGWLEFSRWGIQQIMLISRLYYIKNTIVRRLVDVCAAYVFARGVEVSSPDEGANEVLDDFFRRNRKVIGQSALADLERRKDYDGNLFFVFFADQQDRGDVNIRTIDATEVQEIVCNPDDADTPWFYRRMWVQSTFDPATGATANKTVQAWYPALGYDPVEKPAIINAVPVQWDAPVYHRKCGGVAKWHFGCPRIYPALDWARASTKFLESCATQAKAAAEIARTITTKGGQQAIEGIKSQLETTVNTQGSSLWDQNPPAVDGATWVSGPGTKMELMKARGVATDPEEVRQFKLQCCMVAGVPETFLGDVSTGNLATATSLDRPTETVFLEKQEQWIEDLTLIAMHVLEVSKGAPNGQFAASLRAAGHDPGDVRLVEMARRKDRDGRIEYLPLSEAKQAGRLAVEIKVAFPAIREGDVPALVGATVQAMTLGTNSGVVGIDEKEGVRKLGDLLGMENNDEVVESMYPDSEYEPDRIIEPPEPFVNLQQRVTSTDPNAPALPEPAAPKIAEAARKLREAAGALNGR